MGSNTWSIHIWAVNDQKTKFLTWEIWAPFLIFYKKFKKKFVLKFYVIEKSSLGIPLQKMYVSSIFNMDNQQRPTVEHMELCSMLCSSLGRSEGLGENGHMYMHGFTPSLFTQNYYSIINQPYTNTK